MNYFHVSRIISQLATFYFFLGESNRGKISQCVGLPGARNLSILSLRLAALEKLGEKFGVGIVSGQHGSLFAVEKQSPRVLILPSSLIHIFHGFLLIHNSASATNYPLIRRLVKSLISFSPDSRCILTNMSSSLILNLVHLSLLARCGRDLIQVVP